MGELDRLKLLIASVMGERDALQAEVESLRKRLTEEPCAVCRMRPARTTLKTCEVCR